MYKKFRDRAEFFIVYIEEAHASDMWQMPSNVRDQVIFTLPTSFAEREGVAGACVRKLGLEIPAAVDGIDNRVERAYTAWPDRFYVIDKQGRVALKTAPGPFGFDPSKVSALLESGTLW